jgi:phosphatidylserine/phosphatidylglycerophosphate/cardiolipin synthase-like enzyme
VSSPARRRPWLPLLLLALPLAACVPGHTATTGALPLQIRSSSGLDLAHPRRASLQVQVGADRLLPLPDGGTAFRAIDDLLRAARHSIELEMYELQRDDLVQLLLEAHERGVDVTAIRDPTEGSSAARWDELSHGGVRVLAFPVEARSIDHVKLLIVDHVRAVVGGINWGRRSIDNRDYDLLATGPVVQNLERVFVEDEALAGEPVVIPGPSPDAGVRVLVTRPGREIRDTILAAIADSRRSIEIEMFVLSDRVVVEALVGALRRGVRVRALLEPTQAQNTTSMALLRGSGARVDFFIPVAGEKLHAKLGIFDGAMVIFGSCNWSHSGFTANHELDLAITSPALAARFLQAVVADWQAAAA